MENGLQEDKSRGRENNYKSKKENMVAQSGVKAIEVLRRGGDKARFRKQNWQDLAMDRTWEVR